MNLQMEYLKNQSAGCGHSKCIPSSIGWARVANFIMHETDIDSVWLISTI